MRSIVMHMLLLASCGGSPSSVSEKVGAQTAPQGAPDLALFLVSGLRSAPVRAGDVDAERAFAAGLPTAERFSGQMYAQSSAPFSSVGSILTGRYPGAIPMCNRLLSGEHEKTEAQQAWCAQIPSDVHTLPSVLGVYGYRSLLISADFPGAGSLAVGFDRWVEVDGWDDVQPVLDTWWGENPEQPRLVTVLLGDGAKTVLGQASLKRFPEHRLQWLETVTPDVARVTLDPDKTRAAYVEGAQQAASVFSSALSTVQGAAQRPSWAVVSSTSGMSLDERSGFGGAPVPLLTDNILLDRTLRVPLHIYGAGGATAWPEVPVQSIDILPTLIGLAGAVVPAGVSGRSLVEPGEVTGEAYAEFGDMIALRKGRFMLVFRCSLHNSTALDPTVTEQLKAPLASVPAGHYALYDVQADPLQKENLRRVHPEQVAALRTRMLAIRTGAAAPPQGTLTPQRLWALRMASSEGYW